MSADDDDCTEDWPLVEERLGECERAYADIGSAGYYVLRFVIRPLRDRFSSGERSRALAEEIMAIDL
jgi:hypothetical protein